MQPRLRHQCGWKRGELLLARDSFGLTATGAIAVERMPGSRATGFVRRALEPYGLRDDGKPAAADTTIAQAAGIKEPAGAKPDVFRTPAEECRRRRLWASLSAYGLLPSPGSEEHARCGPPGEAGIRWCRIAPG